MLNFHCALDLLFPSVPPKDQAIILAAMEGRDLSPVVGAWGSASATGVPVGTNSPCPGADVQPESGAGSSLTVPVPFSGPPSRERYQSEPVHPSFRYLLEDRHLAHLLTQWGATS